MKSVNYEELVFVLEQLCEKRDALQDQIDNNTLLIQELEDPDFIDRVGNENDDLFSPRKKIGNRYHREKAEQDRTTYQQQNEELIFDRNKINILIDTIQRVIEAEQDSSQEPAVTEEPLEYSSLHQDLSRIVHKIETCKKMISQDPHRVKQELDSINKNIAKMLRDVSHETF